MRHCPRSISIRDCGPLLFHSDQDGGAPTSQRIQGRLHRCLEVWRVMPKKKRGSRPRGQVPAAMAPKAAKPCLSPGADSMATAHNRLVPPAGYLSDSDALTISYGGLRDRLHVEALRISRPWRNYTDIDAPLEVAAVALMLSCASPSAACRAHARARAIRLQPRRHLTLPCPTQRVGCQNSAAAIDCRARGCQEAT